MICTDAEPSACVTRFPPGGGDAHGDVVRGDVAVQGGEEPEVGGGSGCAGSGRGKGRRRCQRRGWYIETRLGACSSSRSMVALFTHSFTFPNFSSTFLCFSRRFFFCSSSKNSLPALR